MFYTSRKLLLTPAEEQLATLIEMCPGRNWSLGGVAGLEAVIGKELVHFEGRTTEGEGLCCSDPIEELTL